MKSNSFFRAVIWLLAAIGAIYVIVTGVQTYHFLTHPFSPVTNYDYPLIQLTNGRGLVQYELRKGESKLVPYGEYTVIIPDTKVSFVLFKNNRGNCNIRTTNGVLLVETDQNSAILPATP